MAEKTPAETPQSTVPATTRKDLKEQVLIVMDSIKDRTENGGLVIPKDYAVENSLRAAAFIIQDLTGIANCTPASINDSLFKMAAQGLDPIKQQCYFIVRSNKLTIDRSYQGAVVVGKRVANVEEVPAQVIRTGDEFEFITEKGRRTVTKHKQTLESLSGEIVGAYAIVEFNDGKPDYTDIMTIAEIKKSWAMSSNKSNNKLQTDYDGEACIRTVVRRALKPVIARSTDANLYQRQADDENDIEDTEHEEMASTTNNSEPAKPKTVSLPPSTSKNTVPPTTQKAEPVSEKPKETAPAATLFEEDKLDDSDPNNWPE